MWIGTPGKEAVAADVVEVHVRDHDVRDAVDELLRKRVRRRLPLLVELRRRVDHPGVDEDEPVRVVDRMDEARASSRRRQSTSPAR